MYLRILLLLVALLLFIAFTDHTDATAPPVVINELLWMGSPKSAQDEWIELYNMSAQDIDLTGWKLTKLSSDVESDMLGISSGTIPAGGYFLIANYSQENENSALTIAPDLVNTDVSLVNSKLLIRLYNASGTLVDTADEGIGAPFSGAYVSGSTWASMERHRVDISGSEVGAWHTSSAAHGEIPGFFATPRAENSNRAPEILCDGPEEVERGAEATFTATATDADGDTVAISWEFSGTATDGTTFIHTFTDEGEASVRCIAHDGRAQTTDAVRIFVRDDAVVPPAATLPSPVLPSQTNTNVTPRQTIVPEVKGITSDRVLLTALLPNPIGSDATEEFLEITNFSETALDLINWAVTDGSRTYTFTASTVLESHGTLHVTRPVSGVSLNNSGDTIHLIDPFGTKVNGVEYGTAPQGELFLRDGETTHWFWSGDEERNAQENGGTETSVPAQKAAQYQLTTIKELAFLPMRTNVEVNGAVVALPGQLASHTLFIAADDAVVRVYSSTDRFPELALGDRVRVQGQLSQDSIAEKINLGRDGSVTGISEEIAETVVQTINGIVQEKQRTLLALETDDGLISVRIRQATGISLSDISAGASLAITGFFFNNEFLPRTGSDVEKERGAVLGIAATAGQDVATPPAPEAQTEFTPERAPSPNALLAFVLSGIVLALGFIFWYRHRTAEKTAD